jgi:hypothetical protein
MFRRADASASGCFLKIARLPLPLGDKNEVPVVELTASELVDGAPLRLPSMNLPILRPRKTFGSMFQSDN